MAEMAVITDKIEDETKGMIVSLNDDEVRTWIFESDIEKGFYKWPKGIFGFQVDTAKLKVGDILYINMRQKIITEAEGIGAKHIKSTTLDSRERIEVPVYFVPLAYSLYPSTAKQKNMVKAYTNKIGYVPITNENIFKKHTIYSGNAIYYLEKKKSEKQIAKIYSTGWFLTNKGTLANSHEIQNNFIFYDGLVLDSSLTDAFMVFGEKTGLVSLRKDICFDQQIDTGDWIKFIMLVVDEAEKSDENKAIYPKQEEEMTYFNNRHIAIHPIKIGSHYETKAINDKQVQIFHKFDVPMNPAYKGIYQLPHLGEFMDSRGLIGSQHSARTLSIVINSRIINYQSVEFYLAEIILPMPNKQQETMIQTSNQNQIDDTFSLTFLENIQRRLPNGGRTERTRGTTKVLVNGQDRRDQPLASQSQQPPKLDSPPQSSTPPNLPAAQAKPSESNIDNEQIQRNKLPSNSMLVLGIVVDVIDNNNDQFVLAFSNERTLKDNLIRLTRFEISPLPKLGQWVDIIMKKRTPKNRRIADWSVFSAKKREKSPYDTTIDANSNVKVLVKMAIGDDGKLCNKDLGTVNNIQRRINIPEGCERKYYLMAWCTKIRARTLEDYRLTGHWEISDVPDFRWIDRELPPEANKRRETVQPLVQTTLGFIGSSYGKKKGASTSINDGINQTPTYRIHMPTTQPMRISPARENHVVQLEQSPLQVEIVRESPHTNQVATTPIMEGIVDFIDLFSDVPANDATMPNADNHPHSAMDEQMRNGFRYMGFVASHDYINTKGYYIYSRQLPYEVYMPFNMAKDGIDKGTWIFFDVERDQGRDAVSRYEKMNYSPFVVKEERNSVCMLVKADIAANYDPTTRKIATEYVPMVYDINRVIGPSHRGRTVNLKIKRQRLDNLPKWQIEAIVH